MISFGGGGVVVKIDNYFIHKVKRISTYSLSRRNDLRVDSGILSPEKGGGGRTRHILFAEGIGSITNIFCYLIQLLWIVLAPSVHTPPPHFLSVIEHEVKREAK